MKEINKYNLGRIVLGFSIIASLLLWFNQSIIYPDSATYITIAKNFIKYGDLFQWVNWPSGIYLPLREPFTDFAPGLSFLLIPFMYIFKEPVISAIILQSIIIIIYNIVVYKTLKIFNLSRTYMIFGMLLLAFLPNFSAITARFLTEIPFIACSLLAVALAFKSIQNSTKKYWIYVWFLLFAASSFKYIGIFNIFTFFLLYLFYNMKFRKVIYSLIFSSLPVFLWFLRNYILYGYTTHSHNIGKKFDLEVFNNIITKLAGINPLLNVVLVLVVISLAAILTVPLTGKLKFDKENKKIYLIFLLTFIVHFIGIVILTSISKIDALGMRLLSPSLAYLLLAVIFMFNYYSKSTFFEKYLKTSINICFIIVITLSIAISIYKVKLGFNNLVPPQEKHLWNELNVSYLPITNPTHYYTEFNLTNEIYGELPMRVIYNEKWINIKLVTKLKAIGHAPFYLYSNKNTIAIDSLDKCVKEGILEKKIFSKYDVSLYYYNK